MQAYQAFMTYLMQGQDRKVEDAARILEKSVPLMRRWSAQWQWRLRAAAYEEHYLLLRLESMEADRDDMFLRHKALASTAMVIIEAKFNELISLLRPDEDGNVKGLGEEFKPDTLVRLFAEAVKVDRMSVLGRVEAAEKSAQEQERLAEEHADELASIIKSIVNDLNLDDDQLAIAREVIPKYVMGAA